MTNLEHKSVACSCCMYKSGVGGKCSDKPSSRPDADMLLADDEDDDHTRVEGVFREGALGDAPTIFLPEHKKI